MIGFLVGSVVLAALLFAIIQFSFLWAGQGAIETAAHFAARKFALNARLDIRKAKSAALAEAFVQCRQRPGGNWGSAALTSLEFTRDGKDSSGPRALPGEAYRVRLTHWVELAVPWVDRVLFAVAPLRKAKLGDKYYLLLTATRWVTVE